MQQMMAPPHMPHEKFKKTPAKPKLRRGTQAKISVNRTTVRPNDRVIAATSTFHSTITVFCFRSFITENPGALRNNPKELFLTS